jgi:hypothetical protein
MQELQNPHHRFQPAVEIKPGESSTATIKFMPPYGNRPQPGSYAVQIVLLLGHDFYPGGGTVDAENLMAKMTVQE